MRLFIIIRGCDSPEARRDGGAAARPQPDAVRVPRGQTASGQRQEGRQRRVFEVCLNCRDDI